MKRLLFFLLPFLMISCKQFDIFYYQVLSVESDNVQFKETNYLYENDDVKIIYDLWSNGGDPGFTIYNKSDNTIYLNLEETQFVYNGYANDYFKNRTYSYSSTSSQSSGVSVSNYYFRSKNSSIYKSILGGLGVSEESSFSNESGTSYQEKKVLILPPKTNRIVSEFTIFNEPYLDCKLIRYPKQGKERPLTYKQENSPYKFTNIIKYSFENSIQNQVTIKNDFWIIEITNLSYDAFIFEKPAYDCEGEVKYEIEKYCPFKQQNRFYIEYENEKY